MIPTGDGDGGGIDGMEMVMEMMNSSASAATTHPDHSKWMSNLINPGSNVNRKVTKSHSEAERRRRQRINGHLATLRTLLPDAIKMDKASLLTEVVRQVRELKKFADDVAALSPDTWNGLVPGEADEVRMIAGEETGLVRVSVCCEDRPSLMTEVSQAIRSVQARVVKAEMATVGGRTKSVVVFKGEVDGEDRSMLHASLRSILQKPDPTRNHGFMEKKKLPFSRPLTTNH